MPQRCSPIPTRDGWILISNIHLIPPQFCASPTRREVMKAGKDPRSLLINARLDQTRNAIGLCAQLDQNSGQGPLSVRQPSLPAILPYDSPIFIHVQEGDIEGARQLLCSASAHINTVDPYGLSLAYVSVSEQAKDGLLIRPVCWVLLLSCA